jgi:hypothetical protein
MTTKITNDNITSMDAGKLTGALAANTVANTNIITMDASKLTGSLPGGMAPETDLSSVRSDILKLALSQAVDGNRVAYNLEDSFVDGFEDNSGITTETTVGRDTTGEYVSSIYTTFVDTNVTLNSSNYSTYIDTRANDGIVIRVNDYDYSGGTASDELPLIGDTYNDADLWSNTAGGGLWGILSNSNLGNTSIIIVFKNDVTFKPNGNQTAKWMDGYGGASDFRMIGITSAFVGTEIVMWKSGTPSPNETTYTQSTSNTVFYPAIAINWSTVSGNGHKQNNLSFAGTIKSSATSTNATGTLISDPQTASTSRTSASGVIIYEDGVGTSTLGTDLKIYFSCDNSTWTEAASYGTATTYSGTKKLVKLGATNCTAGTSVAMKAVWANQSASKEARLHGWAVNY